MIFILRFNFFTIGAAIFFVRFFFTISIVYVTLIRDSFATRLLNVGKFLNMVKPEKEEQMLDPSSLFIFTIYYFF